jgi:hypothetical protein
MPIKKTPTGGRPSELTDQQLLADAQRQLQKYLSEKGAKVVTAGKKPVTLTDKDKLM